MQNDAEKNKDNNEEIKENRHNHSMDRMRKKKIVAVCGVLAGIFAWLNIWMSQGAFDSIFLGSARAEEQKRQEMMKILEESLSESMAANALQPNEQTETQETIYIKISNKMKQNIPCFYISEGAEKNGDWIMAEGILRAADFEKDMKLGVMFDNQVLEINKVYVNIEEDEKEELKTGNEIMAQINIQSDQFDSVEAGSVIAPIENIHKAKNIVMYACFFETCLKTPQTGELVYLNIAGTSVEVNIGTIKNSSQSEVDEVEKGQQYYISVTLTDEIYIIDNYTVAIYDGKGDYIGNAMLYEEE